MSTSSPVVVVGAGVAGAAIAWRLARQGLPVRLLDAATPAESATWASGGMLAPRAEGLTGELLALGRSALARWPELLAELRAEIDIPPPTLGNGIVVLYDTEDPREWLLGYVERHAPEAPLLDGREVVELGAAPGLAGGIFYTDEAWLDPRTLLVALLRVLAQRGVPLELRRPVLGIEPHSQGVTLHLPGERLQASACVIAAGAAAGRIAGLDLTTTGDRGVLVRIHGVAPPPHVLYHHGMGGTTYVVPDPHGVRIGATSDPHDPRTAADPVEVVTLLERARRIWPGLDAGCLAEVSVGFRPMGPDLDGLPTAGRLSSDAPLWGLLGLHRNGILLAPLLASRIADEIVTSLG